MNQSPSMWQIALGTMVGNIGCAILNILLACILFAIFSVTGGAFLNGFLRSLTR